MHRTIYSALFFLFSLTFCHANEVQWLKMDANSDGKLEKAETSGLMAKFFDRNDENSDGYLDRAELTALAQRLKSRENKKPSRPAVALPSNIEVRKNLRYREGHKRWVVDLYLPEPEKSANQSLRPGMVFVHGGGWKNGSKDGGVWSALPAAYAAKGYVCISVNYRLTPDGGGFPQCVHDVKNAVRWFRASAEEFRLDPNRIGAYGNSAGAHLVSMLGLVKKENELEGDGTYLDQSSLVQAVCASATPSNFLDWGKPGHGPEKFNFLNGEKTEAIETARRASPVSYVAKDAPPFLLFHSRDDAVVPYIQGTALKEALQDVGATVTLRTYNDGGHGVFNQKKNQTYPAMEAFFGKHLGLSE